MEKNILYKHVVKILEKNLNNNSKLNILEIGCGDKIYKKFLNKHKYYGLDIPYEDLVTKWRTKNNKPEFEVKLQNFSDYKKYDLIFSVGTIFMLDDRDLKILIKLLSNLKINRGKAIFFDYNKKTIERLIKTQSDGFNYKQNNYYKLIKKKFKKYVKLHNQEWCSNNILKKNIKEFLNLNKSHILEIDFTKY